VGKGRQVAAVIADNFFRGKTKAIWFSASNSLKEDAKRDLSDIGCEAKNVYWRENKYHIPLLRYVYSTSYDAFFYQLFIYYLFFLSLPQRATDQIKEKAGVLFVTYSMLVSAG